MEENRQLLYKIDEELDSSEVASLKFLCSDVLGRKQLENVADARDLFLRLSERGHLEDDLLFLQELLLTIRRFDLLRLFRKSEKEVTAALALHQDSYMGISTYRKMLFDIAEGMSSENLVSFKFLVKLPRAKLEPSATMLDVLTEMEKQQMLTEDNVDALVEILKKCDKQLASEVDEYRRNAGGNAGPAEGNNPHLSSVEPITESSDNQEGYLTPPRSRVGSMVSDIAPVSVETQDECYQMDACCRGICMIIDNMYFQKAEHRPREGTRKDADDLKKIFTMLRFEVKVFQDLTSQTISEVVQQYSTMDHSDYNAFVMCVLSHGLMRCVLGVDGREVSIKDIYKPFTRTLTLAGKPKLFFIQACQGEKLQTGQPVQEDGPEEAANVPLEGDAINPLAQGPTVPVEADVLIGMATVEEYKAFRHKTTGSIYIQALCQALKEGCGRREDIHNILTRVNRVVSKDNYNNHYKQMPQPQYTLTKKLVIPLDEFKLSV